MKDNSIKFWLIQLVLWGGFGQLNLYLRSYFMGFQPFEFINSLALVIALLVSSGWLRHYFQKEQETSTANVIKRALKGAATGALISVGVLGAILVPAMVIVFGELPDNSLLQILGALPNLLLFLFGWSVVYLLVKRQQTVKRIEAEKQALEQNLSTMQMDLMLNQLNPHFVFNAINNIRAQILEDREKARESLTQLSDVLRSLITTQQHTQWSLNEELELCNGYVDLNQLQYEDRLRIEWHKQGDVNHWQVPRMILQLLIENAIKHGIAPNAKGGDLHITVDSQPEQLHLMVRNPGTLNKHSGDGIGINNIRDRLTMLYGDAAQLSLNEVNDVVEAKVSIQRANVNSSSLSQTE